MSHRGVRRETASYAEVAEIAGRFAAELERRGIPAGERVAIWGENSAEWIGAFFGCLLRGVLAVPLDASGSSEFVQQVLAEVTPAMVVGDAALLRGISTAVPALALSGLASALPKTPNFSVDLSVREDAPFQIVFTSGTMAEPKGIVHTHRNVLASLGPIEREIGKYRRYERWFHPLRFLHTLPLSHVFGQFMGLWVPGILAAELHFPDALEPGRAVELIRRERISVLIAVPRVLGLMRTHLLRRFPGLAGELEGEQKLPALKRWVRFRAVHRELGWKFWAVISGGAALPAELELFWNRLGFALIQGYGMTETAALVTLNHPFHIGQGTIGKALPGREVRLSDAGEILVRGDMVSGASWRQGRMVRREDDWLATGDLAERSESGEFRFVGRKGDAIVTSSGLNIYPSDVEAAMLRQAGVRGCAVVGCALASGMEPVCVVLFSGNEGALQQAVLGANAELTEFQQVRRVLRWPEADLPYTSTGKLLRRRIRDWACAALTQQERRVGAQVADPLLGLLGLIAEITGAGAAQGGDELRLSEDLYLDSLGRVQLASAIEQRMGVEIGEEQMAGLVTLGDLRKAVGAGFAVEGIALEGISAEFGGFTSAAESRVEARAAAGEKHIYPHWSWAWPVQLLRSAFLEMVAQPLISVLLAPRAVERNRGIPKGPLLIIANHVTSLDGPLVLYGLPGWLRRRVAIAMSGEMLLDFRLGRRQGSVVQDLLGPGAYLLLTALYNVFPLPRLQGFKRSFAHAGEALDRGYSVLVFPEGRRIPGEEMGAFRPGIGLLAAQSRVPVLPVVLKGMDTLSFGRRGWFRTGRLEVRVGEAIAMPEGTAAAEWTERLEAEMRRLGG